MKLKRLLFTAIALCISLSMNADVNSALEKMTGSDFKARQEARDELYTIAAEVSSPDLDVNASSSFNQAIVEALTSEAVDKQGKVFLTRILARVGTVDSIDPLLKIAIDKNQDSDIRDHAVMAVSAMPGTAVTELLISGLKSADDADKTMWWQALAHQADAQSADEIIKAVGRNSLSSDLNAWSALAKIGGSPSADLLFDLLDKATPENLPLLQKALLETKSCDRKQLKKLYDSADQPEVKVGAFHQLTNKDPDAAKSQLDALLGKEASAYRQNIIRAALDTGSAGFRISVLDNMDNLAAAEIDTVLAVIGEQELSQYEDLVIELLESGVKENGVEALRTLAKIGTQKSSPVLLKYMESDDETQQDLAIYALSQVDDLQLDKQIIAAIEEPESANRDLMIRLLAIRNSDGAVEILNKLLGNIDSDPNPDEILDAVTQIGNMSTCRILLTGIISNSGSKSVRQYQLVLKRLVLQLAIPDQLWKSAFHPALSLAADEDAKASVIEILDALSSEDALEYCEGCLKKNQPTVIQNAALTALKRWTSINASDYWLKVIEDDDASASEVRSATAALVRLIKSESIQEGDKERASMAFDILIDGVDKDLESELLDAIRSNKGKGLEKQFSTLLEPYKEIIEKLENE